MSDQLSPFGDDLAGAINAQLNKEGVSLAADAPLVPDMPAGGVTDDTNPLDRFTASQKETPEEPVDEPEAPSPPTSALPEAPSDLPAAAETSESPDILDYARTKFPDDASLFQDLKDTDALLQSHINLRRKMGEKTEKNNMEKLGEIAYGDPQRFITALRENRPDLFPADTAPQVAPAAPQRPGEFKDTWFDHISPDTPEAVKREMREFYENRKVANSPIVKQLEERLAKAEKNPQQQTQQVTPQDVQQQVDARMSHAQDVQVASQFLEAEKNKLFLGGQKENGWTPMGHAWFAAQQNAEQHGYSVPEQISMANQSVHAQYAKMQPAGRPNAQAAQRQVSPAKVQPEVAGDLILEGETLAGSLMRQLGVEST